MPTLKPVRASQSFKPTSTEEEREEHESFKRRAFNDTLA
jgi:hypothetical protein